MTTYYISPTGTGNGLSISTPSNYSSIYPLLVDSDTVIFLPGKYRINLSITKSINSANTDITFSSLRAQAQSTFYYDYGSYTYEGAPNFILSKPAPVTYEQAVITGCEVINQTWTNVSGNIWKTSIALPFSIGANQVFYRDIPLVEARYPTISSIEDEMYPSSYLISTAASINKLDSNADGYLCTYTSPSLSNFSTDFWANCNITLIPGKEWAGYTGKVISNSGSTITFRFQWPGSSHAATAAEPTSDDLFYLWGSLDTSLLTPNSYIYKSSTQELFIYLPEGVNPNSCAIGELEYKARLYGLEYSSLINQTNSYIKIEGLRFHACALRTVNASSSLYMKGCDFHYMTMGYENTIAGFTLRGNGGIIENCNFRVGASRGLELRGGGHNIVNNTFNRISIRPILSHNIISYPASTDLQNYIIVNNSVWDFNGWGIEFKYKGGQVAYNRVWNGSHTLSDSSFIGSWDAGDHEGIRIEYNICHDSKDRRSITSLYRLDSGGGKGCWNAIFARNIGYNCRSINNTFSIWGLLPSQYNGPLNIQLFNNTVWGDITLEKGSDTNRQFNGISITKNILINFNPLDSTAHTLTDNCIISSVFPNNYNFDPKVGLTYCDFRAADDSPTIFNTLDSNYGYINSSVNLGASTPYYPSPGLLYSVYFSRAGAIPFISAGAYLCEDHHWNDLVVEQLIEYPNVVKITGLPKGRTLPPFANLLLGDELYKTRYESVDDEGNYTIWYVLPFSSVSKPLYITLGSYIGDDWWSSISSKISLGLSIITQPSISLSSFSNGVLSLNTKALSLGIDNRIPLYVSALQWVKATTNPIYVQIAKSSIIGTLNHYVVKDFNDSTLPSWLDRETSTHYYLWISLLNSSLTRTTSIKDYSIYLEAVSYNVPHNSYTSLFPAFNLSSFKIWLKPDSINQSSNLISSWVNRGLAGGSFIMSSSSSLDYIPSGLNSISGASFSGDDRMIPSGMSTIDTDYYVSIAVYRNPSPGNTRNQRIMSSALSGNDFSEGIYVIPDNTSGNVISYPNGKSKLTVSSYIANPSNLTLGGNYSSTSTNFKGELYELIVWDKPISSSLRNFITSNYVEPKYFNNQPLTPTVNPELGSFNYPVYIDNVLYPDVHITKTGSVFNLSNLPPLSDGSHSISIKAPSGFQGIYSSSFSTYTFSFNYSTQIFVMTRITNLIGTITDRWNIKNKSIKDDPQGLSVLSSNNQLLPLKSQVTNNRIVIGNSSNEPIEIDPTTMFISSSSTVNGDIDGTLSTLNIKAGTITDTKLGNRTVDANIVGTASNTSSLTNLLSWLVRHIKSILGTTNWFDSPPTNLTTVSSHLSNTSNPHGVTASQLGLGTISTQNSNSVSITGGSITGVTSFLSSSNPLIAGTAASGTSTLASREDHIHPVPTASSINTYLGQIAAVVPNSNDILYFNGSSWAITSLLGHLNRITSTNIIFIDDHFICGSTTSNNGWGIASSNGSSSVISSEIGRPGVVQIFNNSGSTGSACLGTNFSNAASTIFLNVSSTVLSITARILSLSATGEEFDVRIGLFDSGIGTINNGAYFIADLTSNFWRCIYVNAGSTTSYTTTSTVTSSWTKFTVQITNSGLNIAWLINNVQVATHTVGTALSNGVGIGSALRKTVGTAQRYLYIDRYTFYQVP